MFRFRASNLLLFFAFGFVFFVSPALSGKKITSQGGRIVVLYDLLDSSRRVIGYTLRRFTFRGDLDTGFGDGGRVDIRIDDRVVQGKSVSIQPLDQKIVVVGSIADGRETSFMISRFNTNGSPDTTFGGGDGVVTTKFFGNEINSASDVGFEDTRKIVVVGYTSIDRRYRYNAAIIRYHPDGTVDSSFGFFGYQIIDFAGSNTHPYSIDIDSYERITVGGEIARPGVVEIGVFRLTSTGALDTTFDGDGKLQIRHDAEGGTYPSFLLTSGAFFVANSVNRSGIPHEWDLKVKKFRANGTVETAFGVGGTQLIDIFDHDDSVALVRSADQKFLQIGRNGWQYLTAVRYNPDGTLDLTYTPSGGMIDVTGGGLVVDATQVPHTTSGFAALVVHDGYHSIVQYDSFGRRVLPFGAGGVVVFWD